MSHQVNTNIIERAREVAEECIGSSWGDQLTTALNAENKDLDYIQALTISAERHLEYLDMVNVSDVA